MSDEHAGAAARLDALETKVAHQDLMIADLNEVIAGQWARIDKLERQLARLREEVDTMDGPGRGPEPPPPHY